MFLYLIINASLLIFSLIETLMKKSLKKIYLINLSILFFLFAFNRGNNDYENYVKIFNLGLEAGDFEIGYIYLTKFIKTLGGNHDSFLVILAIFNFYIIYKYNRYNYNIFIFFYFIYNFLFDINQIRNLLMILMVYSGIYFLEQKNIKLGSLLIFLSIFIHQLALFYIIGVVFYYLVKGNKKIIFKVLILSNIVGVSFFIFGNELLRKMLIFFSGRFSYFEGRNLGYLIDLFQYILNLILLKIILSKQNKKINLLLFSWIWVFIFFPLSFISKELYTRIYRNSYYAKITIILNNFKEFTLKKRLIILILLILDMSVYMITFYVRSYEFIIKIINDIYNIKITF